MTQASDPVTDAERLAAALAAGYRNARGLPFALLDALVLAERRAARLWSLADEALDALEGLRVLRDSIDRGRVALIADLSDTASGPEGGDDGK